MNDRMRECELLFDAAAESLVLLCPEESETVAELTERLQAIARWFGEVDDDHPAAKALTVAGLLGDGDAGRLAELEAAFIDARSRATSLARDAEQPEATRPAMPLAGDAELLRDFGIRASEHLDDADAQLLVLESSPADAEAVDAVFRAFHTIKGMAGFLALDAISEHAHTSESLLADARATSAPVEPAAVQELFTAVDTMRELVAQATGVAPQVNAAETTASEKGTGGIVSGGDALTGQTRAGTIRVDEARLDRLLDTIGELVIAESMVSSAVRADGSAGHTVTQVERLDKITRELQSMATSLRMVDLRATFQRMTRLVRDLSHRSGKPIELRIEGEDTELDKVVVDQITDPLIHALRNAVDHGIEDPEARVAAGKPEAGTVSIRASHAGGAIHLEIADDGRGIDPTAVLERARERGLVDATTTLDDAEVLELIFAPGFSTAKEVTDVSGRGVGMDVVRRTVEELRGRVEITSTPGEGTTLSIRLPLTLAIIDGMVARVGDERYIIPLLSIERSVRPNAEQLSTVAGRGEMLSLPDGLLPIMRLHRMFSTAGAVMDPTEAVVVITSENGVRAGLMVDELLGQQQTVIKPLGDGMLDRPGISGAAIMPDGQVGLILDAAGLVRLAHRLGGA